MKHHHVTKKHHKKNNNHSNRYLQNLEHAIGIGHQLYHHYSNTRTKTKKKEEREHGDDIHSGVTSAGYRLFVNKEPHGLRIVKNSSINWHETKSFITASGAGTQAINSLFVGCTSLQFLYNDANAPGTTYSSKIAQLSLNPYEPVPGGVYFPANSRPANDAMLLKNLFFMIDLTNLSSVAAEVDLYVVKFKRDTPDDAVSLFQNSVAADGMNVVLSTLAAPGTVTSNPGRERYEDPNTRPNGFKNFNDYFKVLKVHHLNMAAASSEKVNFNCKMNQYLTVERIISLNNAGMSQDPNSWNPGNTAVNSLKGSVCIFVIQRGVMVADTTAATPLATYASTKLAIGVNTKWHWKVPYDNANRLSTTQASIEIPTGAAISAQKIVTTQDQSGSLAFAV